MFASCLERCSKPVEQPASSATATEGTAATGDGALSEAETRDTLRAVDQQCRALCRRQHASRAMLRTCVTACDVEAEGQLPGLRFPHAPAREQIEHVLAFEAAEEERLAKQ
jgi:hypothetical protein